MDRWPEKAEAEFGRGVSPTWGKYLHGSCNGVWCLLFGIRRWQHGLGFVLLSLSQMLAPFAQRKSFHYTTR